MSDTLEHLRERRVSLDYQLRRCYENIVYKLTDVETKRQQAVQLRDELRDLDTTIKKLEE